MVGFISMFDVIDEQVDDSTFDMTHFLQAGMRVPAVVIGVGKERQTLQLTVKPSLIGR